MPTPVVYFDPSGGSDDLQLLPSALRRDTELAPLVDVVLGDIVANYTMSTFEAPANAWDPVGTGWVLNEGEMAGLVKLTDYLYVRLRGYNPDPALADAYFRAAMRREIAHVLRWRLAHLKRTVGVTSESDGETSASYREDAEELFPPAFPLHLQPFVLQEGSWSL